MERFLFPIQQSFDEKVKEDFPSQGDGTNFGNESSF